MANQLGNIKIIVLTVVAIASASGIVAVSLMAEPKKANNSAQKSSNTNNNEEEPESLTERQLKSYDVEIKNGVIYMEAMVQEYVANNNGKFPMLSSEVEMVNSSARQSKLPLHPVNDKPFMLVQTEAKDNEIVYLTNRKCLADGTYELLEKPRSHILQAKLASGGFYCLDG